MAVLVMASGLDRLLALKMRRYANARARVYRDLIDMPATVEITASEVQVAAPVCRPCSPSACWMRLAVPWWNGMRLRLTA
ncbi:MAG TPA: hypothetical protein VIC29_07225 [Steroidobacteraceae bacterium]|jgi:hypothetical protein